MFEQPTINTLVKEIRHGDVEKDKPRGKYMKTKMFKWRKLERAVEAKEWGRHGLLWQPLSCVMHWKQRAEREID